MGDDKYLLRTLTKLINLIFYGHSLNGVLLRFDIDHTFIGQVMKQITGLNSFLTSLLEAKNKINPLVQIVGNIVRLKSKPHGF